jgi:hypothetical protein
MYRERLFDTSIRFKKVCLLIFALGARGLGEDRRFWMPKAGVASGGELDESNNWGRLSAGWQYVLLHSLTRVQSMHRNADGPCSDSFFHAHRCLLPTRPSPTEIFDLQIASVRCSLSFDPVSLVLNADQPFFLACSSRSRSRLV